MAHDNDNPMVTIELELPLKLAITLSAKTQFLFSSCMMAALQDVLTPEQWQELDARGVEARPLVFPQAAVVR